MDDRVAGRTGIARCVLTVGTSGPHPDERRSIVDKNDVVRAVGLKFLGVHQFIYERSGGRVGHRMLGIPCLLLRTTGAKSGQPRTSALSYGSDGDRYVVVASLGGAPRSPAWYHNLRAHPEASVQIATKRQPVRAEFLLPEDADYPRLWKLVNDYNHNRYDGYQRLTTRPIPIVVLVPTETLG
jgi:deazaflavin-dependent oxidoreductase (nitroreductase family)